MKTKSFTATYLKHQSSPVFNAVQAEGVALITNRNRPEMVIMLKSSHDVMVETAVDQSEKIRQLTELIKSQSAGDSHKQQDLLKV